MSYMGVKQHCIALEKDGYLDTWRRPQRVGRPELVYRLTKRARDLFPAASNEVTVGLLRAARDLYGPTAPEKLLFTYFQKKTEGYRSKVKGKDPVERARWLARYRDREGHMAGFWSKPNPRVVEHHSPIMDLLESYPIIGRFEQDMYGRVLRTRVQRQEERAGDLFQCTFLLEQ